VNPARVEHAGREAPALDHDAGLRFRSKRKAGCFGWNTSPQDVEGPRLPSGMAELDRVTGAVWLRGRYPGRRRSGIGQIDAADAGNLPDGRAGHRAVYISAKSGARRCGWRASAWPSRCAVQLAGTSV